MSKKDGFGSGFVLGSIVGGVLGGVLGTLLTTRKERDSWQQGESLEEGRDAISFDRSDSHHPLNREETIENARQSLEDKIAQLNLAIDDVRGQLGTVKNNPTEAE